MTEADDVTRAAAAAAMRLAADRGWRAVTLVAVAAEAGVPLSRLYRCIPSRTHLLVTVSRIADEAVLAESGAPPAGGEAARDRLFDVIMRRFDALLPFRDGLAAVVRELPREPWTAAGLAAAVASSMSWMLRAAGIDADGATAPLRAVGLAALYSRVFRIWLADDTSDLSRTMAALDSELKRAERWGCVLPRHEKAPPKPEAAAGISGS